mgnify:CR=1 FL=1
MSLAFVFPGQGSHAVGMGADLAAAFPEAGAVYAEAEYYHDYVHGMYAVAQWRHGAEWEKYFGMPLGDSQSAPRGPE